MDPYGRDSFAGNILCNGKLIFLSLTKLLNLKFSLYNYSPVKFTDEKTTLHHLITAKGN